MRWRSGSRRAFLTGAIAGAAAALGRSAAGARGAPTRRPLTVLLVSGSLEYKSDESLTGYAEYLEREHGIRSLQAFRKSDDDLPGLEQLDDCDVMLLFARRLTIDGEPLERIKKYCLSGRPVVGVRTASHAFQNWLALDKEVFGGDYDNHYADGPKTRIEMVDAERQHPILAGFEPYESAGSLYRNRQVASDVTVLLRGSIPGHTEPIAWTVERRGGRAFYTSLGHPGDFGEASFRRMLANSLLWTTGRIG